MWQVDNKGGSLACRAQWPIFVESLMDGGVLNLKATVLCVDNGEDRVVQVRMGGGQADFVPAR